MTGESEKRTGQRLETSPFIISLLLDLCLDLGPNFLQIHMRLGRLAFLLRHTLSTALFQMGKSTETLMAPHHNNLLSRTRQHRGVKKIPAKTAPVPSFKSKHATRSGSGYDWSRVSGIRQTFAQMFRLESREAHLSSSTERSAIIFHALRVTFTSAGHFPSSGTPPRGQANTAHD